MKDLLISLRSVEERYKGKVFGVGELRIGDMAKDSADAIEKLLAENARLCAGLEAAIEDIDRVCRNCIRSNSRFNDEDILCEYCMACYKTGFAQWKWRGTKGRQ